jgi:phage terminase large subunit-like protein
MRKEMDLMDNPVLRWMFRNVVIYTDPNLNIRLNKAKSAEKIDGCAASVNAIAGYMSREGASREAYGDGREIKFV